MEIWLASLLAIFLTLVLKTGLATFVKGECLPLTLRKWLNYIPVAVMAALVGPDVFIYNGVFNLGVSNLFLMVSIPTAITAYFTRNYFVTIAVGIGLIIIGRYFGL